jgi:hypothetical protein
VDKDLKQLAENAINAVREVYVCMKEYPENCQVPISDLSQIAARLYSELCAADIVPTPTKPKLVVDNVVHQRTLIKYAKVLKKRGRPRKKK